MSNFDAVIFDVDGTITSTNRLIFDSFNHISEKYLGKKLTDEEIIALFGPTEEVIINEWFKENAEEVTEEYFRYYRENHDLADLYPGMKEIIEYLDKKDVHLAIFTGKGNRSATITLKELGVYDYFEMLISGDEVSRHKPDPEGLNIICEKNGFNRERVLLIGDSPVDAIAAREAGIVMGSVIWDSYAKEKVVEEKPDYLFREVSELFTFLKENI